MGKRKKTKAQKIIADLRRQLVLVRPEEPVIEKSATLQKRIPVFQIPVYKKEPVLEKEAAYLSSDLLKTATLSTSIVALEMVLFFLLKTHVLVLPKINF